MEPDERKKEREIEVLVEKTTPTVEDRKLEGDENETFKAEGEVGVGGDLTGVDDVMLDIDGEGHLIFPDDTFPSLPDFPCLSSPPASPSPSSASTSMHAKSAPFSSTTSSSSSSSSSASWSFLQVADGSGSCGAFDMQQNHHQQQAEVQSADDITMLEAPSMSSEQQPVGGEFLEGALDILNDIDLFEMSAAVGPWNPCSIFPDDDDYINMAAVGNGGSSAVVADQEMQQPLLSSEEGNLHGGSNLGVAMTSLGAEQEEENDSSDDLGRVFLDWLRSNRDSISLEDLRSIKLKRATIDSAARRLGGGKEAKAQLVKLILTWVQNNHLQKKRRRGRFQSADQHVVPPAAPYHHQQPESVNAGPNPNHFDYNNYGGGGGGTASESVFAPRCNSWIPYSVDPSTATPVPVTMTAYGGSSVGRVEMVHPSPAAPKYSYNYSCSTSGLVTNSQPFSSSPDFNPADPNVRSCSPQFTTALPHFVPFPAIPGHLPVSMVPQQYSGGLASQLSGHPMNQQGLQPTGTMSAMKEARKKRMARHRRFSSLHHHRNRNQQQLLHHPHPSAGLGELCSRAASEAAAAGTGASLSNRSNWTFWSNFTSSSLQTKPVADAPNFANMQQAPPSMPPLPPSQQKLHQEDSHRDAASGSEKRQGWKSEKNLKFLLQKVLKQSDVGSLGRIVLPKKEAEMHLPELNARDGVSIQMEDIGTNQVWNMRYRYWPNNKSRMYLLENTGEFVRSNGLQEGDFIVIYSDVKCGKYMIRGVKVRRTLELRASASKNAAGKAHMKRSTRKMKGASSFTEDEVHYKDDASPSMAPMEDGPIKSKEALVEKS